MSSKAMISPFVPLSPHASREGFPLKTFQAYNADFAYQKDTDSHSTKSTRSITSDSTCVSYHDASSRTSLSLEPVPVPVPLPEHVSTPAPSLSKAAPGTIKETTTSLALERAYLPRQGAAVAVTGCKEGDVKSRRADRLHGMFGLRMKKASSSTTSGVSGKDGVMVQGQVVSCLAAMGTFLAMSPGGAVGQYLAGVMETEPK